jgi:hypothetical protein
MSIPVDALLVLPPRVANPPKTKTAIHTGSQTTAHLGVVCCISLATEAGGPSLMAA